jgi:hypothetical protein
MNLNYGKKPEKSYEDECWGKIESIVILIIVALLIAFGDAICNAI